MKLQETKRDRQENGAYKKASKPQLSGNAGKTNKSNSTRSQGSSQKASQRNPQKNNAMAEKLAAAFKK